MTPTEKHRETAAAVATKAIGGCMFETADNWTAQKDWATEIIASALADSEREGMKRAAEIARNHFDLRHADKARYASMAISSAILTEAGEG